MSLLSLKDASLAFGHIPLLDGVNFSLDEGERLCVVGRNGTGKSTFLKVIGELLQLDEGMLVKDKSLSIAYLQQDPPEGSELTVFDYVAQGQAAWQEQLTRYYQLSEQAVDDHSVLSELERLQTEMDVSGAWQSEQRVNQVLSQLALAADTKLTSLSGGWLRRVALAKSLVSNPDILLLDEPTNHLDIDTIHWLEGFLKGLGITLIFISHDRRFIRNMATRIVELDRGIMTSWPGNYDAYLSGKAKLLEEETTANAKFDKKLAQEEAWIRQGIKARRTRNEGRVRSLIELRKQRKQRIEQTRTAKGNINTAENSGSKVVFEVAQADIGIDGQTLANQFSALVLKGDRVALVGPNGCGKSTLIRSLMGELPALGGKIKRAQTIEVAYFDQHREALPPESTVADCVADGRQEVMVNGNSRHILGYLQDFLFSPARARSPIKSLSGGEKNRLLLAKLFLKPSNLLVLDEPTNDLDVETLELLEELLTNYSGTVLLVSHDREFVDKIASQIWLFEGAAKVTEIVGGFADVEHYLAAQQHAKKAEAEPKPQKVSKPADNKPRSTKLSYKLKLELESLPDRILELESEIETLEAEVSQAEFFSQPHDMTQPKLNQLATSQRALEAAYERWDELDALANQS